MSPLDDYWPAESRIGWPPREPSPTAGSWIHPSAWLADCVTIGRNVRIGPNCSIGWDGFGYELGPCAGCEHGPDPGDCARPIWRRRAHPFGVVIGDNVEIGAGTVIDRGRYRDTVIGAGTKIDANVFIAHNCLIGEDCLIIANSQLSGSCEIGDRCHIGPAAMLTDHVKVGPGGRCGLGSVVIRDVPAGVTVVGNPAKDIELRRRTIPRCSEVTTGLGVGDGFHPCVLPDGHVGWHQTDTGMQWAVAAPPSDHPGSHGDIRDGSWGVA